MRVGKVAARPYFGLVNPHQSRRLFGFKPSSWTILNDKDKKDESDKKDDPDGEKKETSFKEHWKNFWGNPKQRNSFLIGAALLLTGLSLSRNVHDVFGVEFGLYPTIGIQVNEPSNIIGS